MLELEPKSVFIISTLVRKERTPATKFIRGHLRPGLDVLVDAFSAHGADFFRGRNDYDFAHQMPGFRPWRGQGRTNSDLALKMGAREARLTQRHSGCLRAQPHAECADNLRHGLEARIAVRRERLVKAGPCDAGVLRELHHAARSSDNTERVNQHLSIHGLFEYRLEVVFDIRFGLSLIH